MKNFYFCFLALAACVLTAAEGLAQPNLLSSWKALAAGGAAVEIGQVIAAPPLLNDQETNALQITVKQIGQRFGVVCAEMGRTKLQPGEWYDLSFNARTDTRKTFALTVSLESPNGKKVAARTTLPEVGRTNWIHYTVALHVRQEVSKSRMVIALADTGSIWLNDISVVLRNPGAAH